MAALFALHPLHIESVAWISERKDMLSAFFFMLTLLAYNQYARCKVRSPKSEVQNPKDEDGAGFNASRIPHHASFWYLLALGFFALGLMSKPMLVTLPCVLLLLDFWPLRRIGFEHPKSKFKHLLFLLLEKAPFLALAALFSAVTFLVQRRAGAVIALQDFPLKARLANVVASYASYLGKIFWPHPLAMPYPYHSLEDSQVAGAAVLFAGLSLVALWAARRRPYLFVGWFLFVGMLVPVIGVVQVGLQGMADRYTYLPSIGIFVALAWGLAPIGASPARRWLVASGAAVLIAALMAATAVQVRYWKNSETLFKHALRVTPGNPVAHYLLGAICDSQGKMEQAQAHFVEAIRGNPGNVQARCGLGYILCGQRKFDEAAREYQAALAFEPIQPKPISAWPRCSGNTPNPTRPLSIILPRFNPGPISPRRIMKWRLY